MEVQDSNNIIPPLQIITLTIKKLTVEQYRQMDLLHIIRLQGMLMMQVEMDIMGQ